MVTSTINRIVYFGDSQTDGGNLFDLTTEVFTQPFPLEAFGYSTNVTNGENYADVATRLLGAEEANFAIGGAAALGTSPLGEAVDPDLAATFLVENPDPAVLAVDTSFGGQVQRYLASLGPEGAPEGEAVSIYIALNDFNNFTPTDAANIVAEATAFAGQVIETILGAAAQTAAAGVETVILNTLPLPSFFPTFQFAPELIQQNGDAVISAFNDGLIAASQNLTALGVNVEIVDLEAISAEIAADPLTFNFQTIADQLFFGTAADPIILEGEDGPVPFFPTNEAVAGLDPDQFAFYDLFHPTEALHQTYGVFTAEHLVSGTTILSDEGEALRGGGDGSMVLAGDGGDFLRLGGGKDVALAGLGDDRAFMGAGSDLAAGGSGADFLSGGGGADFLAGGAGDDRVIGGKGRDVLSGGLGSDFVAGGRGKDVLVFTDPAFLGEAQGDAQDLYNGGRGEDTLVLILDDAARGLAEAELEGQTGPRIELASLGLSIRNVENIVFADRLDPFADLGLVNNQAARAEEAELWGFV